MCLTLEDCASTDHTLRIGETALTNLRGGDADARYESLFDQVPRLDPGWSSMMMVSTSNTCWLLDTDAS